MKRIRTEKKSSTSEISESTSLVCSKIKLVESVQRLAQDAAIFCSNIRFWIKNPNGLPLDESPEKIKAMLALIWDPIPGLKTKIDDKSKAITEKGSSNSSGGSSNSDGTCSQGSLEFASKKSLVPRGIKASLDDLYRKIKKYDMFVLKFIVYCEDTDLYILEKKKRSIDFINETLKETLEFANTKLP